ncbi:MAG: cytochrome c biogenesis protein ResB [Thermodesulfovibrionales bacterium]|nr:cytochrome c biogenesis protein ResB [Thermodesulfovibrionales bacterium]
MTLIDKIRGLLASIKFAIVIFALISLTAIIGTVLEQRAEPARNIQILSRLFGESLAPIIYRVFEKLGFMDMYHSWWFITLLILLSANIIICSLDRLPRIWKMVREPIRPLATERFEMAVIKRELLLRGKPDRVKDSVAGAINGIGFSYVESKEDKGYQFYSQKGNYTRLGVYITHTSIIFILIGALVGISFGFKGFLNLPEGRSYSIAFLHSAPLTQSEEQERDRIVNVLEASWGNTSKASEILGIKEKSLKEKLRVYGIQPLGFSIRCDDFDVEFYEGSDMPKKYRSWLTVIEDGKEVLKKAIEVNDPLKYKGITFYQSSYGMMSHAHGWFILRITSHSGVSEIKRLNLGDRFTIHGTDLEGTIKDFSPALSFDHQGRPFTFTNMMNNPAVFIDFNEGGKKKYSGWILKRYPITGKLPESHVVEFIDLWGTQYTGLQVRKDPGVWIVYLGCITIAIGLYMAFFMSHKKLWVRIVEEKDSTRVYMGATSNKNRSAFERKIDKLIFLIRKRREGGD